MPPTKRKILAMFEQDEAFSKEEFLQAFKNAVSHILRLEKQLLDRDNQKLQKMESMYNEMIEMMKKDHSGDFEGHKKEMMKIMKDMMAKHESKMNEIDERLMTIKDGLDGKDADENRIIEELTKRIPPPLQGKDGKDFDPQLVEELESKIKLLEERISRIPRQIPNPPKQLRMEPFSFTGDAVTTAFSLPKAPGAKGRAIWAYLNGQQIQLGTHFTIANKTMNTTFTPANGDIIEGYILF